MRNLLAIVCLLFSANPALATTLFSDDFNSGASALWGNQLGGWTATGGVYDSSSPNNTPPTFSLVNQVFSDFVLDVDINSVRDGGLWLRSDSTHDNALVLVTGGGFTNYTGLYFHQFTNGNLSGPFGVAGNLFQSGDNIHLQVQAQGTQISLFLNNNLVQTITDNTLGSGYVGLYDFSSQTFDNFVVTDGAPEPGTVGLFGIGMACIWLTRRSRRRAG